jgi:hypothetical protein
MPNASFLEKRKAERLDRRKRNRTIAMVAGVAIFAIAAFLIYKVITGVTDFTGEIDTQFPLDGAKITSSGLVYKELVSGEGPAARAGDTVSIIYTGYLPDGQIFDSNVETGQTLEFVLGAGTVIQGWEEGITGMQVGGARLLVIPPDLALGASDPFLVIPENATLTYSITLKGIK